VQCGDLYPLYARNLETNVTDSVAYHSLFRFYVVQLHVCIFASFLLRPICPVMFQQLSACPVCHTQTGQADWPFSLARLFRHVLGRPLETCQEFAA